MKPVSVLLKGRGPVLHQIGPEANVFAALERLAQGGVGALLVMEGDQLVGVVSERDYTRKVALQGRNSRDTLVRDIMTAQVLTVTPRTDVRAAMQLMSDRKIRHLPVVDEGRVLGMISIRDLLDDIIAEQDSTIAQMAQYIQS